MLWNIETASGQVFWRVADASGRCSGKWKYFLQSCFFLQLLSLIAFVPFSFFFAVAVVVTRFCYDVNDVAIFAVVVAGVIIT